MAIQKPEFIKVDPKQDKIDLIKKYQRDTDTVLYPAQDAMALINLMVYYANLVKAQINDAASLNLVQYSRYPILDFLGKYKKCPRTCASKGSDILKIKLNTVFSYDLTIRKGFLVKSKDGAYIFETVSDLLIPAGETTGSVKIESQTAASDVNKYKAGEIDTVISSAYSYIESVENLNGVEGGSDDEEDEHYIERILLAPEGFSVAGPEAAYIYFTKSAHSTIVDVAVETPEENITIKINDIEVEMTGNTASNDVADFESDYQEEHAIITLKQALSIGDIIKVKIPHPYKIIIYVLTESGETSQVILDKVLNLLNTVRPLCDYVVLKSAILKTYEISGTIYLTKDADEEIVQSLVNEYLTKYIKARKNKLNRDVVRNQIIKEVCKIPGVYDFDLKTPGKKLTGSKQISYSGNVGTLTFVRTDKEED